jgi:hypothetical protein
VIGTFAGISQQGSNGKDRDLTLYGPDSLIMPEETPDGSIDGSDRTMDLNRAGECSGAKEWESAKDEKSSVNRG